MHNSFISTVIQLSPAVSALISAIALGFVIIQLFTVQKRENDNRNYDFFKSREILRPFLSLGTSYRLKKGSKVLFLIPLSNGSNISSVQGIHFMNLSAEVYPPKMQEKIQTALKNQKIIDELKSSIHYVTGTANESIGTLVYLENSSDNTIYKCITSVHYLIGNEEMTEIFSFNSLRKNETIYFDLAANKLAHLPYTLLRVQVSFETAVREPGESFFNVEVTPLRDGNSVLNNPKDTYMYDYDYQTKKFTENTIKKIKINPRFAPMATHVHTKII